ncbi:glycosyl hydrolase [Kineococcus rhizosphaerae]|uniref:glycosyl hydrolase n=1 Tax=Kineococcus rhizosphaerae TaxID=559628 RepID=UPI0011B1E2BA|nr:glycosyl hydrolase [Kineococcus rhizosphaerae]
MDTTHQESPATGGPKPPRKHGRRKVIGAGVGVLAAAAAGAGVWWGTRDTSGPATPAAPQPTPHTWQPRAHVPAADLDSKWIGVQTHDVAVAQQFEDYLGRPLNCVVVFGAETDWPAIEGPWFAIDAPQGQDWAQWVRDDPDNHTLVISTAMVPKNPDDDWRARGAAGEYDEHWVKFGQNLVDAGLGSSIVRIGWELNGKWYATHYVGDTADKREQWKEYFRRIVKAMEVEGSNFEVDFNIAEGPQNSVSIEDLYPGDDYVDVIGVDVYDSYISPIDPTARWQAKDEKVNSISAVVDFAASRDKPVSFPEWAMVASGSTQGGGDSPEFVNQMADVMKAANLRYQAYFNTPDGGVGMTLADAPNGSEAFLKRFGASGDVVPDGS